MKKYIRGFIKFLLRPKISKFAMITDDSTISNRASVYRFAKIYSSTIDDFSYVGPNSEIICADLGKYCSIAANVNIGLAAHTISYISTSPIFTEQHNGTKTSWINRDVNEARMRRCIIGNDVWIGTKVVIKDGIKIGDGAIVGAGSVVTHDVPPYAIVAGAPAKIIRYRFNKQTIDFLINLKWWNWPESVIRNNINYFQAEYINIDALENIESTL